MSAYDNAVQNASSYRVRHLREASNYVMRVAATSAAGIGRHASARFTTPRLQPAYTGTDGLSVCLFVCYSARLTCLEPASLLRVTLVV